MLEERVFWLAWTQISGVGPILLKRLLQHFGSLAAAWEATPAHLKEVEGFGAKTVQSVVEKRNQIDPEKFFLQHQQKNPFFLDASRSRISPFAIRNSQRATSNLLSREGAT